MILFGLHSGEASKIMGNFFVISLFNRLNSIIFGIKQLPQLLIKLMNTLICTEPGRFKYKSVPEPVSAKGRAIIRIQRIGICGTDLHAFEGTQPYFTYPRVLGHELAGELISYDDAAGFTTGEAVTFIPYFNCGQCIACRNNKPNCCTQMQVCGVHVDGGMAEYLSVPSSTLLHGQGLSVDQLALVEPLSIGAHGIRRA